MYEVYWVGWVNEGNHDKLWGVLKSANGNTFYNFWCRRGATMQFKKVDSPAYRHKEKKGYKQITPDKLDEIYPTFMQEAEMKLVFANLSGAFAESQE